MGPRKVALRASRHPGHAWATVVGGWQEVVGASRACAPQGAANASRRTAAPCGVSIGRANPRAQPEGVSAPCSPWTTQRRLELGLPLLI